jgi:hypothetical protein
VSRSPHMFLDVCARSAMLRGCSPNSFQVAVTCGRHDTHRFSSAVELFWHSPTGRGEKWTLEMVEWKTRCRPFRLKHFFRQRVWGANANHDSCVERTRVDRNLAKNLVSFLKGSLYRVLMQKYLL